jgi:hypothetical protein
MATEGSLTCRQFTDWLIRRTEHLDADLIKDITPTDGWIGHVSTGRFAAFDGVSHTFDRINRVYPNLSGCWTDVQVGSCVGSPCDPEETKIGFGSTRDSYTLQTKSYSTDLFCFDLVMSADRAKEQFAGIISNLKNATNIIMSDRLRNEALRIAGTKIVAGASLTPFTFTTNADCTEIVPSALPTSKTTIQMLMRQIEPLKLNGYFGANPGMPNMVEYVTDMITGYSLVQGNSTLANLFRFDDFAVGGNLYKYGLVNGVGNFGFRYDSFPLRYQLLGDGVTLQRVMPYTNEDATQGIKGVVNDAYVNARYQIDFIWNRMAMKSLTADSQPINPMMPFAARDFAGKWQFVMDNLGATEDGCVIENKRRNKGMFIADFRNATKAEHPEWAVAILTLREIACVVDVAPCSSDPGYVTQDYNSANDVCTNDVITFDISATDGPYNVAADSILCNGVPIDHDASGDQANLGDLAVWLNANAGELGTWAWPAGTLTITLTDSTCNTVTLTVT